jgi:hypothetical protein
MWKETKGSRVSNIPLLFGVAVLPASINIVVRVFILIILGITSASAFRQRALVSDAAQVGRGWRTRPTVLRMVKLENIIISIRLKKQRQYRKNERVSTYYCQGV